MNVAVITRKRLEYCSALLGVLACFLFRGMTDFAGVGYFVILMAIHEGFWIFLGGQVTDITGRMLRSRYTKGQATDAKTAWGAIVTQQILLGLLGAFALGFTVMKLAEKVPSLSHLSVLGWLLMPAFFFRSISAALAGFCAGKGSEGPAGLAAILRVLIFLVFAFVFLGILMGYGEKVGALLQNADIAYLYAGIGLVIAADMAELLILLFLLIVAAGVSKGGYPEKNDYLRSRETSGSVLAAFWSRKGVDLLNQFFLFAPLLVLFFFSMLSGEKTDPSRFAGVVFLGYFGLLAIVGLVSSILTKLMVAKTVSAFRKEEMRSARNLFQNQFHWSVIIGSFFMAYFASMSETLADFLSSGEAVADQVLLMGAFPMLFLPVILTSMELLIQDGHGLLTAVALFLSGVISCVFGRVLLMTEKAPFLTFVQGILIWSICMVVSLTILTLWKLNMNYDLFRSILIPVAVGVGLGLVLLLVSGALRPHLGDPVTLAICFVILLVLYNMCLLLLRNLTEKEVRSIPGGKILESFGHLLRVL